MDAPWAATGGVVVVRHKLYAAAVLVGVAWELG